MIALASIPTSNAPPDLSGYAELCDAAELLKKHPGYLRRLCETDLQFKGLAIKAVPADGGQRRWFVNRSYDALLTMKPEVAAREQLPAEWEQLTDKQRELADRKRKCVVWLRAARDAGKSDVESFPEIHRRAERELSGFTFSYRRLWSWEKSYRCPRDLFKLAGKRGGDQKSQGDDEAWAEFGRIYHSTTAPKPRAIWKHIKRWCAQSGLEWCSDKSCSYQVKRRFAPARAAAIRTPRAARNGLDPYISQNPESWQPRKLWISDHKQLDVLCRCHDGRVFRPWLTVWMDWRSRKIVGFVVTDQPNSTSILASFAAAIKDASNHGWADEVRVDGGKDYDAYTFQGRTKKQRKQRIKIDGDETVFSGNFGMLDVKIGHSLPYNPTGKARMERFFGRTDALCRTFASYTGQTTEGKPDNLGELPPHAFPTFETVKGRVIDLIAGYNLDTEHAIDDLVDLETGARLSPGAYYEKYHDGQRVLDDPNKLKFLLLKFPRPVYVHRNGISISVGGATMHFGQYAQELIDYKALKKKDRTPVRVAFDPEDLSCVHVWKLTGEYVCRAPENLMGGAGPNVSEADVKQAMKEKARYNRAVRDVEQGGVIGCLTSEEQIAQAAAKRQVQSQSAQPMRIVSPPLEAPKTQKDLLRELKRSRMAASPVSAPQAYAEHADHDEHADAAAANNETLRIGEGTQRMMDHILAMEPPAPPRDPMESPFWDKVLERQENIAHAG